MLVSAITPTLADEEKTTNGIGLAQGLAKFGESVCLALREPSLGPAFGRKGGATKNNGASQVVPAGRINLHFTGDFHAIRSAHNLLAALIDNHLHFNQEPRLDARRVTWPRVMDMNGHSLRNVNVGLGGCGNDVPQKTSFDITAASEVMAALCHHSRDRGGCPATRGEGRKFNDGRRAAALVPARAATSLRHPYVIRGRTYCAVSSPSTS